jgi:hypothetical protein
MSYMTPLRCISIYVDEAELGYFHWFLIERGANGGAWAGIATSPEPFRSWMEAFDAGCVELFRLTEDERVGPRVLDEVATTSSIRTTTSSRPRMSKE